MLLHRFIAYIFSRIEVIGVDNFKKITGLHFRSHVFSSLYIYIYIYIYCVYFDFFLLFAVFANIFRFSSIIFHVFIHLRSRSPQFSFFLSFFLSFIVASVYSRRDSPIYVLHGNRLCAINSVISEILFDSYLPKNICYLLLMTLFTLFTQPLRSGRIWHKVTF